MIGLGAATDGKKVGSSAKVEFVMLLAMFSTAQKRAELRLSHFETIV